MLIVAILPHNHIFFKVDSDYIFLFLIIISETRIFITI